MPVFVSQEGLFNLQYYKYSGEDRSLLVKYIFSKFWNTIVEYLPKKLAPNVITLLGGIFMVIAFIPYILYVTPTSPIPLWIHLLTVLCIFLYQTADNLDGKQARRTQSSSPLGELFDHGVDSIMIGIFAFIITLTLQLNNYYVLLISVFLNYIFYLSHWDEYHVGILILGYIMNPTELQIGTMGLLLLEGFCPALFNITIFKYTVNQWIAIGIVASCCIGALYYMIHVIISIIHYGNHSILKAFI